MTGGQSADRMNDRQSFPVGGLVELSRATYQSTPVAVVEIRPTVFSFIGGVHSYLLFKSAYIPRILSGLYLFAAVWLLLCCFGFIIAPKSMTMSNAAFIVPDFVAELPVGLWLAFKGANVPLQGD